MDGVLRTPEARFADLPDFPFAPNYLENLPGCEGLRAHYVDEGPRQAQQVFLCLHGEPTWSYLYRRMIPVFTQVGHRTVAPDLFGFGRSDKPSADADYTFEFHRRFLLAFIERLDLTNITLVVQDWGGLLGLTLPMEMPERFSRLLVMNTMLATGDLPLSAGFVAWRAWVARNPDLDCAKLLARACPHLSAGAAAAYEAPYPDVSFKAGARRFPALVPDHPDAPGAMVSRRARDWLTKSWKGETFMAVGATDPVLGVAVMETLRGWIRDCPAPYVHPQAGHFAQEWGEDIARHALDRFSPDETIAMNATDFGPLLVSYDDVASAARRIEGKAHRTPVMTSTTFDGRTGAKVFFKCENLQRMGAFKFRGAYNALSQLSADEKKRGVLAYSSGNHAQAVALAGRMLGVKPVIVMPMDAPAVKVEATRGYGAEVLLYDKHKEDRETFARNVAAERGLSVVPPFDHPHVAAGQGTAAKELFDEVGALDYLLVPCGGGGLLSGCAVAANTLSPSCKSIGVEPELGDDATRSFRTKTLQSCHNPETIADGARTHSMGKVTFPLVMRYVADMMTVNDTELLRTMFWLWERMKIVVEPTGALAAAALLEGKISAKGARVGVIISGGNVDLRWAGKQLAGA